MSIIQRKYTNTSGRSDRELTDLTEEMLVMTKEELLKKYPELALYPEMLTKALENPGAYMMARILVRAQRLKDKAGVGNGN